MAVEILVGTTIFQVGLVGFEEAAVAVWQVQEAKTKLSEVIDRAHTEGPQTITRHGKARAVVISMEEYEAMTEGEVDRNKPRMTFKEFLLSGPKFDDLDQYLERSKDTGREIDFD
jgi:prevent-host-death family protein